MGFMACFYEPTTSIEYAKVVCKASSYGMQSEFLWHAKHDEQWPFKNKH